MRYSLWRLLTIYGRPWPIIGGLTSFERFLGWHDVRCEGCRTICGNSTGGGSAVCGSCVDWLQTWFA